jgi:HlyD family secretion protein
MQKLLKHKIWTAIIILIVLVCGYFGYSIFLSNKDSVRYSLTQATKGTLTNSISGSGQISALNQVDIKPEVSGTIISVAVKSGQSVRKGDVIAQIDSTDAQKAVRDAEINLETAQISLNQTRTSENNAETDLEKAYDDGFNSAGEAITDAGDVMNNLQAILFGSSISNNSQWNIDVYISYTNKDLLKKPTDNIYYNSYQNAKESYQKIFSHYQQMTNSSDRESIKSIISESYQTSKLMSEAVKNSYNLIYLYKNALTEHGLTIDTDVDTYLSDLNSYKNTTDGHISALFNAKNTIDTTGTDPLNIRSKELALEQKQNALTDAQSVLADYSVRAPFDGIIAALDAKEGDEASSSATIATIITKQKIAEISLNEVDIAKIKAGQKAILSFDAISELSIVGNISEVDSIGTASSGVVTYAVKIAFGIEDDRLKPSMSVSAQIITETKTDTLLVPNSAVKTQNGVNYVQIAKDYTSSNAGATNILLNTLPQDQQVEIGSSNDEYTEITSGLKEGDFVVVKTTTAATTQSNAKQTQTQQNQSQQNDMLKFPGGSAAGGLR